LNLWRGWAVQPVSGDCSLWLEMVRDVICSGDEALFRYVMNWAADAVQNLTERPGVTLVLLGKQGVGKGTFARELGKLFGEHFMHIRHARHLSGNFNAHLVNALMVFADEAYFPGDKQSEGALKGLITEPTIPIEYKGKDVIQVSNYMRVIMASNQFWVVPAGMDNRRFTVMEVSEARAKDKDYFKRIRDQMNAGGREALLHHLMHLPLTEDLNKIPQTQALLEQQIHTMDPFIEFWFHRLSDQGWVEDQKTAEIRRDYKEMAGRHPVHETAFGTRLLKMFPSMRKVRLRDGEGGHTRTRYYQLPALVQARKEFEKHVGRAFDWHSMESRDEDRDEPM
jgi:phage/plasmid-associated DNA primase